MEQSTYIKERVNNQIDWYDKKSSINKTLHLISKSYIIISSSLITLIMVFDKLNNFPALETSSILGFSIAVVTGLSAIFKFQEKWTEYRTTSETLKHEKYLFLTNSGLYEKNGFPSFVNRIETLISSENSDWNQYITQTD